jgi:hypothetical protein
VSEPARRHSFRESLAFSHQWADAPFWEVAYRRHWPDLQGRVVNRADGLGQRSGVDCTLTLSDGRTIAIDEKVDRRDNGCVFLETWSNVERRQKGWARKQSRADFIAYAFAPLGLVVLLEQSGLLAAVRANGWLWREKYRERRVANERYTACGVPVPYAVLLDAIAESYVIDLGCPLSAA